MQIPIWFVRRSWERFFVENTWKSIWFSIPRFKFVYSSPPQILNTLVIDFFWEVPRTVKLRIYLLSVVIMGSLIVQTFLNVMHKIHSIWDPSLTFFIRSLTDDMWITFWCSKGNVFGILATFCSISAHKWEIVYHIYSCSCPFCPLLSLKFVF